MSKINKYFLLVIIAITSIITFAFTNKITEGIITYSINMSGMEGLTNDPTAAAMMKDAKMIISFNDKFVKTEMDMGMVSVITIADIKKSIITSLMDMMGKKLAIEMSKDDLKKKEDSELSAEIEYLDETKEIAGYKCKSAIVKTSTGISTKIFYTDEFQLSGKKFINGMNSKLPGTALEFEVNNQGINIRFTATKIEQKKLSNTIFDIPSGYEQVKQKDLMNMMMNIGGQ